MPETRFDDERVQAVLAAREIAVLATVQPGGAPLAMAMWFAFDPDGITMVSVTKVSQRNQSVGHVVVSPRSSLTAHCCGWTSIPRPSQCSSRLLETVSKSCLLQVL